MKLNIGNHDFSIIWDGVYYKALSDYPNLTEWEIKSIQNFIRYERKHHRDVCIEIENEELKSTLLREIELKKYKEIARPNLITECTACNQNGCTTDYLCHIASSPNALKIIELGKLLSAKEVRDISIEDLLSEDRNAAKDPADFFDYIMFSWGNCQAGDRLVMERKLNQPPTEEDLSINFTPGIRFYFDYDDLKNHPNAEHDGYHALKIKKELIIENHIRAIVIPKLYQDDFRNKIPENLRFKVHFLKNDCNNIWDWSEKVYNYVSGI